MRTLRDTVLPLAGLLAIPIGGYVGGWLGLAVAILGFLAWELRPGRPWHTG